MLQQIQPGGRYSGQPYETAVQGCQGRLTPDEAAQLVIASNACLSNNCTGGSTWVLTFLLQQELQQHSKLLEPQQCSALGLHMAGPAGTGPAMLAEASEQQGGLCLHNILCRPRQASSCCCSRTLPCSTSPTQPARASQVQVVLAVARGVGRHLRFLEAVLHIRHMRYYIIFALVRRHSVLGDTRTDQCPVTWEGDRGSSVRQPV